MALFQMENSSSLMPLMYSVCQKYSGIWEKTVIYEILPQLIELWGLNTATQVESKKNIARLTAR